MTKRWIICQDKGVYVPVEINGRETKKLFLVLEKDNKENWRLISSCLRHRTRINKDDRRLFIYRHDAIDATINHLQTAREGHLAKAEEILEDVRKLRGIR